MPTVPETIDGRRWEAFDTDQMANDLRFFAFAPGERWYSFASYAEHQYFVAPCKLMLTTPGMPCIHPVQKP